jgi:hypothetical protein
MRKKRLVLILSLVLVAIVIASGVYAYQKFYKTGSATEGVARDFYEGNTEITGTYSYNQLIGAWPRVDFFADESFRTEIPDLDLERIPRFTFENTDQALEMLNINRSELNDDVCEITGSATIEISNYKVLKAEIGGSDTAQLDRVVSLSKPTIKRKIDGVCYSDR